MPPTSVGAMRARDLAGDAPTVRLDASVVDALRLVADGAPGVVVVDADGRLVTALPGSQVLALSLPSYLRGHPALARTWDEAHADRFAAAAEVRTVGELLPSPVPPATVLAADDTLVEIAAAMCDRRSPLAVVVEDGRPIGVVTTRRLVAALLPPAGPAE